MRCCADLRLGVLLHRLVPWLRLCGRRRIRGPGTLEGGLRGTTVGQGELPFPLHSSSHECSGASQINDTIPTISLLHKPPHLNSQPSEFPCVMGSFKDTCCNHLTHVAFSPPKSRKGHHHLQVAMFTASGSLREAHGPFSHRSLRFHNGDRDPQAPRERASERASQGEALS